MATRAMQAKYRLAREAAYADGHATFAALATDPSFRDFVCLYLAGGSKRRRNEVEVCNSDPAVVKLCDEWLRRLSAKARHHRIQTTPIRIQLAKRTWRSVHGVLTVVVYDTLLRARLDGWMDCLREGWP